uniref:Uncharacterized protein n=1 Tax=Sphaerodactylus townsendi TaxID=933632 RepID=A0ACB8EE43_9SAUR
MQTERVAPLALPRGRKVFCELCRAPATVRCGGCGVTFYCAVEHHNADWANMTLILRNCILWNSPLAYGLEFAKGASLHHDSRGGFRPGTSLPSEEYSPKLRREVSKTSQCSSIIQSKLHRNLGLLFAAKGNFEESLYHLANDVVTA